MTPTIAVLCYHRVLPGRGSSGANRPYFARGTAVSRATFRQQVRTLGKHFDVLTEEHVLGILRGHIRLERPACWVTFDDAYFDVWEHAAPILDEAGLPASLFVATSVLSGGCLPADRWYETLSNARRRTGTISGFGGRPWHFNLDSPRDFGRLVDGPEKSCFLRSTAAEQEILINRLAEILGSRQTEPGSRLYLSKDELQELGSSGWTVGSHTVSHALLPGLSLREQREELTVSREHLERLGFEIRSLAYPDGAWDGAVADCTRGAGYDLAAALGAERLNPLGGRFALPRFIVGDDPRWVESTLLAARSSWVDGRSVDA